MCKAHVLRFCCGHGVLMGLEPCRLGPCPMIKSCGEKLPAQPSRCYNCQHKRTQRKSRLPQAGGRAAAGMSSSCAPEGGVLDEPYNTPIAIQRATTFPRPAGSSPRQQLPSGKCMQQFTRKTSSPSAASSDNRLFSFTCTAIRSSCSSHLPMPPHYINLPSYLPHQDHDCPPCQLTALRDQGERIVTRQANIEYPHLTADMLIRNGTLKEWQEKPSFEAYLDERLTEEREMWLHVSRKWTQDLKKIRVLVAEEDGLGLMS